VLSPTPRAHGRSDPALPFLREQRAREADRWRHIRDPRVDRRIRRCSIGTPTCSTHPGETNGTSFQSNAINTSANDLMVACFAFENDAGTITFSDLGSATWHTLTKRFVAGPGCCLGWAVASGATTNNKVTAACTSSVNAGVSILVRVSGCDTSSPFDVQNGNTGTSAAPSAGNLVTTVNDEILFNFAKMFAGGTFSAWFSSSGTELLDDTAIGIGYRIVSATGTYAANATFSGSADWADGAASFKAASSSVVLDDWQEDLIQQPIVRRWMVM
jgi:hypothetical protein